VTFLLSSLVVAKYSAVVVGVLFRLFLGLFTVKNTSSRLRFVSDDNTDDRRHENPTPSPSWIIIDQTVVQGAITCRYLLAISPEVNEKSNKESHQ
jgi:hypothetical protein